MGNYDGWRLYNNEDSHWEKLNDACRDAESAVEDCLNSAIESCGVPWSVDEVVGEVGDDDEEIRLEVGLKLANIISDGRRGECHELGVSLIELGKAVLEQQQAASSRSGGCELKMAPSARTRRDSSADCA